MDRRLIINAGIAGVVCGVLGFVGVTVSSPVFWVVLLGLVFTQINSQI